VELLAQRKNRCIANEAFSEALPMCDGTGSVRACSGGESALEEATDIGQWRLESKVIAKGKLESLFKLQLGVIEVCLAA